MTTLAGIELHPDLHLMGFENNPTVSYSSRDLLGGSGVIQVEPRDVGANLRLIARHDGSSRMGTFCQHQLESLQLEMNKAVPVTLEHPRGTYTVYILDINVEQSDEREAPGDFKKFHGEIILQEVEL